MKSLAATAILTLSLLWGTAASAQVYGTNDDPYQQNPFASGMTLPEQPAPPAPAATPPATPPQDTAKTQTAASMGSSSDTVTNTPAKKPATP